jgi:hypothetical protein
MAGLLTTSSVLMCPHGGSVQITSTSPRAKASDPLARASDTFMITGCPMVIGTAPHPCVLIQWVVTATRCKSGGQPLLNESSVGLCLAADQAPQGTAQIISVQPKVTGL